MISEHDALDTLDTVITAVRKAGADAADALFAGGESASVSVRLGEVEDITRSEDAEIGLRAFVGDRSASVSLSDFAPAAIEDAAARAVAMARAASADQYAGLAPEELLLTETPPDLDLDDEQDIDLERLECDALACEDAARAIEGVTNSGGGGASAGRSFAALATSHGVRAARTGSSHNIYASVIAGDGAEMQRDYAQGGARHYEECESAETVGTRAGERTVARLNPSKVKSGSMPVLFDPRVSGGLLGHLVAAINGAAIARGTSFLDDPEAQVFAKGIQIIDDPHRLRGRRSRPFDGEGLPTTHRALVEDGRLTGWLANSAAARQLGIQPTGHAVRGTSGPPGTGSSNLHLEPGDISRDDLITGVEHGILVTELIGQGVSTVTGDYSRGASGFLIEKGEITCAVSEITIAGNLKDMFAALVPADDLEFKHATNAPTVRIDGMTVAGE
ncbi:MAG: TldD/PmbA family protein [Pacificimonas sp.]